MIATTAIRYRRLMMIVPLVRSGNDSLIVVFVRVLVPMVCFRTTPAYYTATGTTCNVRVRSLLSRLLWYVVGFYDCSYSRDIMIF